MGPTQVAAAFATVVVVFASLLMASAMAVSTAREAALRPLRMVGPAVKRWGGVVLAAVGVWFVVLAAAARPVLTG